VSIYEAIAAVLDDAEHTIPTDPTAGGLLPLVLALELEGAAARVAAYALAGRHADAIAERRLSQHELRDLVVVLDLDRTAVTD